MIDFSLKFYNQPNGCVCRLFPQRAKNSAKITNTSHRTPITYVVCHDHGAEASLRVIYERHIFAYFHPFGLCVCFMKSSIFYLCCDTTGTDKKGWKLNLPVRSCARVCIGEHDQLILQHYTAKRSLHAVCHSQMVAHSNGEPFRYRPFIFCKESENK